MVEVVLVVEVIVLLMPAEQAVLVEDHLGQVAEQVEQVALSQRCPIHPAPEAEVPADIQVLVDPVAQ